MPYVTVSGEHCCNVPRGFCSECEGFLHLYVDNLSYCPECGAAWDYLQDGSGWHVSYAEAVSAAGLPNFGDMDEVYDDYNSDGVGLFNYSYRPQLQFRGTGDYHLGLELEIGTNSSNCQPIADWARANDAQNLFYCKEDGSVAGFEIVTHPMTHDYFHSFNWESFFAMLNDEYPNGRGDSRRNSESVEHGIHVHVSRTAFQTPSVLARWCYLFNRNAEPIGRIARRRDSNWARWSQYPVHDVLHTTKQWPVNSYDMYDANGNVRPEYQRMRNAMREWQNRMQRFPFPQRYQAINHTNDATCEVRVFRSTRKPESFRQAVGLVASTVEYARSLQLSHKTPLKDALTWDAFTRFCEGHETFNSFAGAFKSAALVRSN